MKYIADPQVHNLTVC